MLYVLYSALGVLALIVFVCVLWFETASAFVGGRSKEGGGAVGVSACLALTVAPLLMLLFIPLWAGWRWYFLATLPAVPAAYLSFRGAAAALGSLRGPCLRHARSPDPNTRLEGIRKLVAFHRPGKDREVRGVLQESLSFPHGEVLSKAALALHRSGQTGLALDALVAPFRDAERLKQVGGGLGKGLREVGPAVVDPLARLLESGGVPTPCRLGLIRALWEFEDSRATAALLRASRDPEAEVRAEALNAVGDREGAGIPARVVEAFGDPDERVRAAAAEAAKALDDSASAEALVAAARDAAPRVRLKALHALAVREDPRLAAPALEALGQADPELRVEAIDGLGRVKANEAVEPLLGVLAGAEDALRAAAAEALGKIGDGRAREPLLKALSTDPSQRVRGAADAALDSIGWKPRTAAERCLSAVAKGDFKFDFRPDDETVEALLVAMRWEESAAEALSRLEGLVRKEAARMSEPALRKIVDLGPLYGPPPEKSYEPTPLEAEPARLAAREELARRNPHRTA